MIIKTISKQYKIMIEEQLSCLVLYRAKFIIKELEKMQNSYYDNIIETYKIKPSMEEWVFDWVYNSDKTLEDYLEPFGIKIEDLFHE